jgi:hypothetical protein
MNQQWTPGAGQRPQRGQQAWTGDRAGRDGVPDRAAGEARRTQVAGGRHARRKQVTGAGSHPGR